MIDPKKIRTARGTRTQRQYAEAVGVDSINISRWERGENSPGLDSLALLAREADKPIEWFLVNGEEAA